jgi:hypothetical protein
MLKVEQCCTWMEKNMHHQLYAQCCMIIYSDSNVASLSLQNAWLLSGSPIWWLTTYLLSSDMLLSSVCVRCSPGLLAPPPSTIYCSSLHFIPCPMHLCSAEFPAHCNICQQLLRSSCRLNSSNCCHHAAMQCSMIVFMNSPDRSCTQSRYPLTITDWMRYD